MSVGSSAVAPVASAVVTGVGNAMLGLGSRYFRLLPRRLVERIVPKPGTGPSAAARERGYHKVETYTKTTTGARYVARMEQRATPATRPPRCCWASRLWRSRSTATRSPTCAAC
jgi:short subunit dehydrogenase-like uncharacterized protein